MNTAVKSRKSTKQSELRFIARCQFKAYPHAIVYAFQSGEKRYHVTILGGRVTGCQQSNGEECKGWKYGRKCRHGERALALEATRLEELHDAAVAAPLVLGESFAQDIEQHAEDDYGHLPGAEKMIVVSDMADPWADPSYDPFKGMTEDEKRAARFYAFENVA